MNLITNAVLVGGVPTWWFQLLVSWNTKITSFRIFSEKYIFSKNIAKIQIFPIKISFMSYFLIRVLHEFLKYFRVKPPGGVGKWVGWKPHFLGGIYRKKIKNVGVDDVPLDVGQILCKKVRWESGGGYFWIFSEKVGFVGNIFAFSWFVAWKYRYVNALRSFTCFFFMKRTKTTSQVN